MDDFPAAPSMDTSWFAVDAAGHVGLFYSGEEGHVPESVGEARTLIEELWSRFCPQEDASWEFDDLVSRLGLYYFDYDDYRSSPPIAPYCRTAAPELPLHVDQLPPALRREVSKFLIAGVDFAKCSLVQPLEQARCILWSEEELAYLCSDGKTVRPVPGMEHRFADFCEQFRKENPQEAEKRIFEE